MTSIIWGAFGLTLMLIVAVGAMIQYSKDRNKYKKTKVDEWSKAVDMAVVPKIPVISEPVTSFIKFFKDNPKRFKVTREGKASILKDALTNKKWVFIFHNDWDYIVNVGGKSGWVDNPRVHVISKGCEWITVEEKSALVVAMYPYFTTERRDRLHAIQRERLTRIYKETP